MSHEFSSLADEELAIQRSKSAVSYDLQSHFPSLKYEDFIKMAKFFAMEAPFNFVHWPTLKHELAILIRDHVANSPAHLACILMVSQPFVKTNCVANTLPSTLHLGHQASQTIRQTTSTR